MIEGLQGGQAVADIQLLQFAVSRAIQGFQGGTAGDVQLRQLVFITAASPQVGTAAEVQFGQRALPEIDLLQVGLLTQQDSFQVGMPVAVHFHQRIVCSQVQGLSEVATAFQVFEGGVAAQVQALDLVPVKGQSFQLFVVAEIQAGQAGLFVARVERQLGQLRIPAEIDALQRAIKQLQHLQRGVLRQVDGIEFAVPHRQLTELRVPADVQVLGYPVEGQYLQVREIGQAGDRLVAVAVINLLHHQSLCLGQHAVVVFVVQVPDLGPKTLLRKVRVVDGNVALRGLHGGFTRRVGFRGFAHQRHILLRHGQLHGRAGDLLLRHRRRAQPDQQAQRDQRRQMLANAHGHSSNSSICNVFLT